MPLLSVAIASIQRDGMGDAGRYNSSNTVSRRAGGASDDQGFRAVILKLTKVRLAGRFRVFCGLELGSPKVRLSGS